MMRHPEHHVPQPMRNTSLIPQMAPAARPQPMLMTISSAVPVQHTGVLVSMPQGPALITTTSIPDQQQQSQQPRPAVYHYKAASLEDEQQTDSITNTNTSSILPMNSLANTKEKTPMCMINELARYNKIQHQYRLTGEQGPAHKKLFTVTLRLGSEEYESNGTKIKKAQHNAADLALQRTEYKHPPLKIHRNNRSGMRNGSGLVTPTVELNALAMKRGERTVYMVENGAPPPPTQNYMSQPGFYPRPNLYGPGQPRYSYDPRRNHTARNYHPQYDRFYGQYRFQHPAGEPFSIRLRVGDREYPGVGYTVQAARHDAASKALEDIKQREVEENQQCSPGNVSVSAHGSDSNSELSSELKSPISLVHEIALKRNLNVIFEVLSEKGPPHMKVFVTQCRVGELVAEGEGNGKKVSKKRAAEKMLEELGKLAPLPPTTLTAIKRKRVVSKKKQRNLIKLNADNGGDYNEEINPISRLIQIQQANKEKEPIYTVLEERGVPRRREFVIEASVGGHSANGVGPKKKVAKRNAAEALLTLMGHGTTPVPQHNAAKTTVRNDKEAETNDKGRKVTFMEEKPETNVGGSGGRQLVPGLLLVNDQSGAFQQKAKTKTNEVTSTAAPADAKKTTAAPAATSKAVRAKEQLLYLTQLLGVQVQFSDFPKANHEQYLTLVSLSTSPPQVCHGEGPTTEASHEKAALEALTVLSDLGLDNVTPSKENDGESAPVNSVTPPVVPKSSGINQNGIKK